jgi:hypothetical protein
MTRIKVFIASILPEAGEFPMKIRLNLGSDRPLSKIDRSFIAP